MKFTKKLLAGLLAISMVATGSSVFAATDTIKSVEEGSNTATQNVTGTGTFVDDISVEITWQDLTFNYTKKWNSTNNVFGDAEWELANAGGNAIKATNKSAGAYNVELSFKGSDAVGNNSHQKYSGVQGEFYSSSVDEADDLKSATVLTENKLKLDAINLENKEVERSATAYLWLKGNPVNDDQGTADAFGTYEDETFGTVTATLSKA